MHFRLKFELKQLILCHQSLTAMKNSFFSILFLLSFFQSQAQSLEFGVKAGINTGKTQFNDLSNYSLSNNENTTLQAGVYSQFKIWLIGTYIQPELLLTRRTNTTEITGILNTGGPQTTSSVKSNDLYLNVPIYIGKQFFKLIRVYAGPNFQLLLNPQTSLPENANLISKNELSKFVTGFAVGAGVNIFKFRADIRYDYTGDIGSHIQINQYLQPTLNKGMISIQLGYKLFGTL